MRNQTHGYIQSGMFRPKYTSTDKSPRARALAHVSSQFASIATLMGPSATSCAAISVSLFDIAAHVLSFTSRVAVGHFLLVPVALQYSGGGPQKLTFLFSMHG